MHNAFRNLAAALALSVSALSMLCAPIASASIVMTLEEVGGDVVATGSGQANIMGLTVTSTGSSSGMQPNTGFLTVGPTSGRGVIAGLVSGPTLFGTGGNAFSDSGGRLGDYFGVGGSNGNLYLPLAYVSGSPLSGSNTWGGRTFATMGITPGSYTWTWSYTGGTDSITINAGSQDVPAPAPLALLLAGLAGWAGYRRAESRL